MNNRIVEAVERERERERESYSLRNRKYIYKMKKGSISLFGMYYDTG